MRFEISQGRWTAIGGHRENSRQVKAFHWTFTSRLFSIHTHNPSRDKRGVTLRMRTLAATRHCKCRNANGRFLHKLRLCVAEWLLNTCLTTAKPLVRRRLSVPRCVRTRGLSAHWRFKFQTFICPQERCPQFRGVRIREGLRHMRARLLGSRDLGSRRAARSSSLWRRSLLFTSHFDACARARGRMSSRC